MFKCLLMAKVVRPSVGVEYGATIEIKGFAGAVGKTRAGEAKRATEMTQIACVGDTANHVLKALHLS